MHEFKYKGSNFYCGSIKVGDIAKQYSTPLYIYSHKAIIGNFLNLQKAFRPASALICYSVKANSNLSILKIIVKLGAGLDIVSGGELYRARMIKCPPRRIVYASVGKTAEEIKEAIKYGILMFNAESEPELDKINTVAQILNKKVDVALRVNPDVEPKTHRYITTGKKETKFGIDIDSARKMFLSRRKYSNLNIVGIHIHIGSQITTTAPFIKAIKKIKTLNGQLKKRKVFLKYFNIGGGLGIVYDKEKPQTASEFAQRVLPLLKEVGLKVILEPGRFILGNAGILAAKVIYIKDTPHKRFIVVDAAMNDLLRPSLYGAYHKIIPLVKSQSHKVTKSQVKKADIVGPVCESSDFMGKNRRLNVKEGNYLAVMSAGAYGFSMSSNYNSRRRCAEVLIRGNKSYLIRKRETYRDLVNKEIITSV